MRVRGPRLATAFLLLCVTAGCASRPAPALRRFPPADEERTARALAAWDEALRRANALPPSRLLYDAKFGKGTLVAPGTLAVVARRDALTAKATGPFGGEIGDYENGAYRGKHGETDFMDPHVLRAILAGVWRGGPPAVAGADQEDGLLRWKGESGVIVEGVLDLSGARLKSLRMKGPRGELSIEFSGPFDPWPEVVRVADRSSGRTLKLRRIAVEPLPEEMTSPMTKPRI
jgi:hypothetical protein